MANIKATMKTAIVKTLNGEFSIDYANSRDFINGMRSAIERKALYEFTNGNTRTLINCNNVVSIEMVTEALSSISPFLQLNVPEVQTPEEIREIQLGMQPDILKFEAKAKAMEKMKAKQDAERTASFNSIYGPKD